MSKELNSVLAMSTFPIFLRLKASSKQSSCVVYTLFESFSKVGYKSPYL